ncbi:MAG: hypothetical protein WCQ21_27110, partial [Verrucomicrobiota bacterium]
SSGLRRGVQIGTAKGAKSVFPHLAQSQDQRKTAKALEPLRPARIPIYGLTLSLALPLARPRPR